MFTRRPNKGGGLLHYVSSLFFGIEMLDNKFFVFEGMDGSGKTSIVRMVAAKLREEGYDVITSREPGGTPEGEKFRSIILGPKEAEYHSMTYMFLLNASRMELVDKLIKPSLEKGKVVLLDRYVDSTIVYQGYVDKTSPEARQEVLDTIMNIHRSVIKLEPNTTFLVRTTEELVKKRIIDRGDVNNLDQVALDNLKMMGVYYDKVMEMRNGTDTKYSTLENVEGVTLELLAEQAFVKIKEELDRLDLI